MQFIPDFVLVIRYFSVRYYMASILDLCVVCNIIQIPI